MVSLVLSPLRGGPGWGGGSSRETVPWLRAGRRPGFSVHSKVSGSSRGKPSAGTTEEETGVELGRDQLSGTGRWGQRWRTKDAKAARAPCQMPVASATLSRTREKWGLLPRLGSFGSSGPGHGRGLGGRWPHNSRAQGPRTGRAGVQGQFHPQDCPPQDTVLHSSLHLRTAHRVRGGSTYDAGPCWFQGRALSPLDQVLSCRVGLTQLSVEMCRFQWQSELSLGCCVTAVPFKFNTRLLLYLHCKVVGRQEHLFSTVFSESPLNREISGHDPHRLIGSCPLPPPPPHSPLPQPTSPRLVPNSFHEGW